MKITAITNGPPIIEGQTHAKKEVNSTQAAKQVEVVVAERESEGGRTAQSSTGTAGKPFGSSGYQAARCGYADAYLAGPKTK
jgi:hypothetical protein